MNREDAINEIISIWRHHDSQLCASDVERAQSKLDMVDALTALGVTKDEMAKCEEFNK